MSKLFHSCTRTIGMEKTTRCTLCGKEFSDAEIVDVEKCPNCGTKSIPCSISEDVEIKINWHELRILTIWAENWARKCDRERKEDEEHESMLLSVMTIAQRLQKQFPAKVKLTLFSELKELRKKYDIETDIDDENLLGI